MKKIFSLILLAFMLILLSSCDNKFSIKIDENFRCIFRLDEQMPIMDFQIVKNGTKKTINTYNSDLVISGFDTSTVGSKVMKLEYKDQVSKEIDYKVYGYIIFEKFDIIINTSNPYLPDRHIIISNLSNVSFSDSFTNQVNIYNCFDDIDYQEIPGFFNDIFINNAEFNLITNYDNKKIYYDSETNIMAFSYYYCWAYNYNGTGGYVSTWSGATTYFTIDISSNCLELIVSESLSEKVILNIYYKNYTDVE